MSYQWYGRAETPESSSTTSRSPSASPAPYKNDVNVNERDALRALQSEGTGEVLRSVLCVRKTWKARGGETVWPLELEAALLEGLEQYVPDDSRETRILGRFPRRNRFIADYIFEKTGKRRTPKQIGSRLQQLRESCGGKQLRHLLSPFHEPPPSPTSVNSPLNSPSTPPNYLSGSNPPHNVVYIDILPNYSTDLPHASAPPPSKSAHSLLGDDTVIHTSPHPRALEHINPTVCFTSPVPISAHARFTVSSAGLILHAESVPLELLADQPPGATGFVYSTRLVPQYWRVILQSPDPTRFTIFQEVVKDDSAASLVYTATFYFSYPSLGMDVPPSNSPSPIPCTKLPYPSALGLYDHEYARPALPNNGYSPEDAWSFGPAHAPNPPRARQKGPYLTDYVH